MPPPDPPFELTKLAGRLRERALPLGEGEDTRGWAYSILCEALLNGAVELEEGFDPDDPHLPVGVLMTYNAPGWALPWAAQIVGLTDTERFGLDEQGLRDAMSDAPNWQSGTTDRMRATAQLYLTGTKTMYFRERDASGTDPAYTLEIVTLESEVPPSDLGRPVNLVKNPSGEAGTVSAPQGSASSSGTLNLHPNPSAETSLNNVNGSGQTGFALARSQTYAKSGTWAFKITQGTPGPGTCDVRHINARFPVVAGQAYSAAAEFHADTVVRNTTLFLDWYDASGVRVSSISAGGVEVAGAWARLKNENKIAPAGAVTAQVIAQIANVPAGESHYIDAIIANPGAVVYDYVDGSTPGLKWSGTVGESSTIAAVATNVDTTAWAKVGTHATRYTVTRLDGSACYVRTAGGTPGVPVLPNHYYAARVSLHLAALTNISALENWNGQIYWYKSDGSAATPSSSSGPTFVAPVVGSSVDTYLIAQAPADAAFAAVAGIPNPPVPSVASGWLAMTVDADAFMLVDLGDSFTGPVGAATNETDVPDYVDGTFPGCMWDGTAHNSTSHVVATNLVEDALEAAKPVGIVLIYRTVPGWDYQAMIDHETIYSTLPPRYATYRVLSEGPQP